MYTNLGNANKNGRDTGKMRWGGRGKYKQQCYTSNVHQFEQTHNKQLKQNQSNESVEEEKVTQLTMSQT